MKKTTTRTVALIVSGMLMTTLSFAETFYAKKNHVKVTQEKSSRSEVITKLNLGDEVEVVSKQGRKYQVQLDNGDTGWVFKFKLTKTKPEDNSDEGDSSLAMLTGGSAVSAEESRSGGSIRGLKETSAKYAASKKISPKNQQEVDQMVLFNITQQQLAQFQQDGKIGEYSESITRP